MSLKPQMPPASSIQHPASSLADRLPTLRRLRTEEELRALQAAAATDAHAPFAPSHLVHKNGEIVGYGSLGVVPLLTVWLHSAKVRPIETIGLMKSMEAVFNDRGAPCVVAAVDPKSPFAQAMPKLGWQAVGTFTLYLKTVY
jgi:hypothetical protein